MEVNMSTTAASTRTPVKAPAWAAAMRRFNSYLVNDFGGGPRPWKLAWVINFQKVGTFPFLGFLIAWYHNTSTSAWIYLAMHGSYGLVWIIKTWPFPIPTGRTASPSAAASTPSSACWAGIGCSAGC
jgi:hypothetical protein